MSAEQQNTYVGGLFDGYFWNRNTAEVRHASDCAIRLGITNGNLADGMRAYALNNPSLQARPNGGPHDGVFRGGVRSAARLSTGLLPLLPKAADLSHHEKMDTFVSRIFADLNVRAALPALRETIRTWSPDLIVRESAEFGSAIAAAEAGIPFATVATSNRLSEGWVAARASASIDVIRGEVGLDQDDGASLLTSPTFTSFPASLDGDAPPGPAMSLFRVRTTRESVRPGRPVPAWAIDDGRPLVFVTFGTLAAGSAKNHGLFRAALDAVAALPVRALMSTGAEMDKSVLGVLPANVTVESWVPQGDIFPRASALVCHGGSGTLLAGLAHGLPMVIVPLTADQPDNARRVEALGAGVTILDHDAISLRAAIEQVISEVAMRSAADRMAREMAALATMDDAVRELERLGRN